MARGGEMIENPATGERVVFRRTAAETNGELLEYEFLFRPRGFVAAEHVHPRQEERHEVLGGRLGISVAGREQVLQPGDVVVVPAGTPHRLWSVDDEPAHVLFQLRPALRAEELISTFVHLARAGKVGRRGYPRLLQLAVLADEFGDEGFVTRPPRRLQQAAVALLAPLGRRCGYRADYRTSGGEHRRLTTGIRRFFYVASLLVLAVGAILFVGSTHTARYFAWTIKSPLTAAFLGANYLAAVALELLAARQREWARVRVAFWPVLAFTSVTLVVTLIHLDRFHLHGGAFVTRLGTWIWLAIYVVVPPVMIVLGARQLRVSGVDAPRSRPFPRFFSRAVVGQAAVLTGLGAALLIAPLTTANVWPWALTPLTGRAIGAWLLGMGLGSLLAVREADFERARIAFVAFGAAVLLQVVALARYGDRAALAVCLGCRLPRRPDGSARALPVRLAARGASLLRRVTVRGCRGRFWPCWFSRCRCWARRTAAAPRAPAGRLRSRRQPSPIHTSAPCGRRSRRRARATILVARGIYPGQLTIRTPNLQVRDAHAHALGKLVGCKRLSPSAAAYSAGRFFKHVRVRSSGRQYGMIWPMARRQTLIQLDDARLAALDERAAASGRSRSDLVREAIDLLLGTGDAAAIDAAIVEGYERVPAPDRDPWAFEGAVAAIRAEPW